MIAYLILMTVGLFYLFFFVNEFLGDHWTAAPTMVVVLVTMLYHIYMLVVRLRERGQEQINVKDNSYE